MDLPVNSYAICCVGKRKDPSLFNKTPLRIKMGPRARAPWLAMPFFKVKTARARGPNKGICWKEHVSFFFEAWFVDFHELFRPISIRCTCNSPSRIQAERSEEALLTLVFGDHAVRTLFIYHHFVQISFDIFRFLCPANVAGDGDYGRMPC